MNTEMEEKLLSDVAAIKTAVEGHTKMLDNFNYTLNGNGKPGLKTVVDQHENTLSNMKKVMWIIATPILAAMGGGIVTGAVYLIHQIPKN